MKNLTLRIGIWVSSWGKKHGSLSYAIAHKYIGIIIIMGVKQQKNITKSNDSDGVVLLPQQKYQNKENENK